MRIEGTLSEFDAKGDGIIDKSELLAILNAASTGGGSTWDEASVDALVSAIDTNGDGHIKYHDFAELICDTQLRSDILFTFFLGPGPCRARIPPGPGPLPGPGPIYTCCI